MKKLLPVLLLTGCAATVDPYNYKKPEPTPIICPFPQIEYCTGGNKQLLACQCVDQREMKKLRDTIMFQQNPNRSA